MNTEQIIALVAYTIFVALIGIFIYKIIKKPKNKLIESGAGVIGVKIRICKSCTE